MQDVNQDCVVDFLTLRAVFRQTFSRVHQRTMVIRRAFAQVAISGIGCIAFSYVAYNGLENRADASPSAASNDNNISRSIPLSAAGAILSAGLFVSGARRASQTVAKREDDKKLAQDMLPSLVASCAIFRERERMPSILTVMDERRRRPPPSVTCQWQEREIS